MLLVHCFTHHYALHFFFFFTKISKGYKISDIDEILRLLHEESESADDVDLSEGEDSDFVSSEPPTK